MSRIDWRYAVSTALGVLAGMVATAGTLSVAVAGFTLSYDAIRKVGIASGVRPDWAWLLPVSIDGAMAVGTVTAVVMNRMGRRAWYPWLVVLAGAGISIACNALHATMRDHIHLDDYTAMAVSAIPAVMLALSVHLLVVLIDSAARALNDATEPDTTPSDAKSAVRGRDAVAVTRPDTALAIDVDTALVVGTDTPVDTATVDVDIESDIATDARPAPKRTPARTVTRTPVSTKADTDTAKKVAKLADKLTDIPRDKLAATIAARIDVHPRTVRRHLAAIATDTPADTTADTPPAPAADTTPDTEPAPKSVNGTPVPELIDA